jgi:hypothetical protein
VHGGCRRCIENIKMQNREEMVLLLSVIHASRSWLCGAAEMHRRGIVHRMDMLKIEHKTDRRT